MTATQAPTPGPLSGDDELIERGLRSIRTYDAVRSLRDALTATTARLTGYDWNADPDAITKQQGDAFAAADRVFSDLDAAVAAHPDIDLPECDACNGTGKIEEPARPEGANQHSACVRSCAECDGCGFAPDERLAPTPPVEASGSERTEDALEALDWIEKVFPGQGDTNDQGVTLRGWQRLDQACATIRTALSRPQPSGETRESVLRDALVQADLKIRSLPGTDQSDVEFIRDALSTTPARAEAQDEGAAGEPVAWRKWTSDDHPPYDGEWFVAKSEYAVRIVHYADKHDRLPIDHTDWAWPSVPTHWLKLSDFYRLHPSPTPAADVQRLEAELEAWKLRGDNHWETLRSIREFAREGDCERIIKWVNDAGSGYTESAEQTLGQMTDRALKAEAALASTPAADADRVRIAVETLEAIVRRAANAGGNWYGDVAAPALAALKSTAAKEGGA